MCAWCRGSSSRHAGRGRHLSVLDSRVVINTGTGDLRNLEERAEGKKQVLEQRKRSSIRFQRERDFDGSHGGWVTEQETANSMQIEFGKYEVLFRKSVLRRFVKVGGRKGEIQKQIDREREWGCVAAICFFRRTAGKERQKGKRAEISLPHRKGEIGSRQSFVSQRDRVLDREGQHNHTK